LTAALTVQLQFCRALFLASDTRKLLSRLTLLGVVLSFVATLPVLLSRTSAIDFRVNTILVACLVLLALMFTVVIQAAWQRNRIAWLWIAAYLPLSVCLGFTLLEQLGRFALPWLPYNAIGFAVAFEVMVLLLALHLHVKSSHAKEVRKMTLIELDPLTGFVSPRYYPDTLAQLWSETRHLRQDFAIAYIRADIGFDAHSTAPRRINDELILRCVRMLRMVTRADDTVARIGANVFAILMPGTPPGHNFSGKLSRLVALGLMRDHDDLAYMSVKFRIAATTFSSFSGTSGQLDRALKEKLSELTTSSSRSIEFVRNR
jgi:GGDEF domain-containing protein